MKIRNKLKQKGILLSLLTTLFLLLAVFSVGYLIKQEAQVVMDKRNELTQLKTDLDYLDRILSSQKENEAKIKILNATLPANFQENARAIVQFERLAGTSNLTLETKIEENSLREPNNLSSIKVSLKTVGSFNSLTNYLSSIANLPYHTRFDTLKIETAGKDTVATTNLRLFLRKDSNQ